MSWLARSIATSLRLDDDDANPPDSDNFAEKVAAGGTDSDRSDDDEEYADEQRGGGMKEDLSELKQTLTRQIWGVASFLAPPPPPPLPNRHQRPDLFAVDRDSAVSDEEIEVDSAKCRSGGYRDLGQMLPFRLEDQIGGAVGITEESLAFASNIAHHPETWLDFPLSEEDDIDDFDMSDAQCKHAEAVERLVPRLAALRIELCPVHMSWGYFWKVYFVLLYSRLNRHDAEMLSTQQLAEARSLWMQELQKRLKPESFQIRSSTLYEKESSCSYADDFIPYSPRFRKYTDNLTSSFQPATCAATELEIEKYPVVSSDSPMVDKSVIREESVTQTREKGAVAGPSSKGSFRQFDDDDDGDAWLEQQSVDGYCGPTIFFGTDDDVSFSDLEDDCTTPMKSKSPVKYSDVSPKAS
ncbi:hypothetical protein DCAR_0626402 [Daucus carota subsp. sativus]|uniref:BSD domain-containing protein n=1 Tax=Daucus carota subsp. sativus TaxID=79200 RepID=A0AAF0XFG9_DAUCS|nr:PREDICTED: uncharacterized protein LOC108224599 [Daucus carota subsp. sativus]WOH06973.1 hypothetical protein DCAR_0626402 [Daucus carota subsp. sativus]